VVSFFLVPLYYQIETTTKNNQKMKELKTIVAVKTIKGTTFIGVRNYKNQQGEVSNQTFIGGINYDNLLKNDLEKLLSFDKKQLGEKFEKEVVEKSYTELVESLKKRTATKEEKAELLANGDKTMVRSEAQKEAYTDVCKGLRIKDNHLYIFGLIVNKTILEKGVYKDVKSKPETICKNEIKKLADLRETKFKNFKLGEKETLALQGVTI
jgi:hypothetical protein